MGGLGAIITIIIIVAWVVKGLASVTGNENKATKNRKHRSLEEWDQLQAQRREEMGSQQQALSEMRADASAPNPAQMTMAERIELARQRARQQAGGMQQADTQAEALRRARAQAEQQARQQRERALQQQRAEREREARQHAARERERAQQHQRRLAQQKAQELEQQRRRRSPTGKQQPRQPQRTQPAQAPKPADVIADSIKRVHYGHEHGGPTVIKLPKKQSAALTPTSIGPMDRDSLRRAFILKEMLDKPVALRDPLADLPS